VAIELIRRPIGHKISITPISVTIVDNGAGDAVVYVPGGHSLSDGDYIYIESNLDSYNGFKYVDSIAYDYFKIQNSENSDPIEYVQDAEATIYISLLNHGWQCVHLPIVYELKSDLYPNNIAEEEYIPNTIDSFEDYNGYTKLNLDRAIDNVEALNYIELIPPVSSYNIQGPYQIISVIQPWAIVINLAYDVAFDFTGYQVVNYYNNYNINVEVWAGLGATHRWEDRKPYELAATLKFIPDSQGRAMFSIHEILKGYIETRNNLTLDTLPNNLDFHVGFYIKYYESYDLSDGETIATETGAVTTDTFEGHAINAMLPFKSLNSGHLSEYVDAGDYLARWLTLFDRPIAVVDRFFDISFLNQYDGADVLILRNGELFQTITTPGSGVIRVMFIPESGYTEYCLQALLGDRIEERIVGGDVFDMTTFQNGPGNAWTLGANPEYSNSDGSALLYVSYPVLNGNSITINYNVDVQFLSSSFNLTFTLTNSSSSLQDVQSVAISSVGQKLGSVVLTATADRALFAIFLSGPGVAKTVVIEEISEGAPSTIEVVIPGFELTERICIDIVEECGTTFVNDDLRITDGDQLRRI
jgi:hypothetical protein